MLGIHRTREGEAFRNGLNWDWISPGPSRAYAYTRRFAGPSITLFWDSPWFLVSLRLRWRIWAMRFHVGAHWWPRALADLNAHIISAMNSGDEAAYQWLKLDQSRLTQAGSRVRNYRHSFGWPRQA